MTTEQDTPRPWVVGSRFMKRSYKANVWRTYTVLCHDPNDADLLHCEANHGGRVTFGARQLDRYVMQGVVKLL